MRYCANILKFFLPMALLFSACTGSIDDDDLDDVLVADSVSVPFLKGGKLVVLMSNNIASYYVFKGQPRGFEYEMLRLFCKENGLELEIKIINDFDYLLDSLVAGKGDIAAGNLTRTKARLQIVDFSPEVLRTRQVLVQRLPDDYKKLSKNQIKSRLVQDPLELDGKTVYVNAGSSFYSRLQNFADENGLDIETLTVNSDLGTDELVDMVSKGVIDYTVVDENIARIHKDIYKNIDISVPLSLSQSIAWAIPKGQDGLKALLVTWMDSRKNSTRYNMIFNKYYGTKSDLRNRENYLAIQNGKISSYDKLIQKHAEFIDWDWLLLAALINKESRFNPGIESNFGAIGLMQVLPMTGKRFGVDSTLLRDPELNIMAGTRFLQWLDNFWLKRLDDTTQIKYFVLASYNAGPGHVLDAMYLAEKYGLNPQKWHGNVEVMLKNKSQPEFYRDPVVKRGYCNGIQPVEYVNKVFGYYAFYKAFDERKTSAALAE